MSTDEEIGLSLHNWRLWEWATSLTIDSGDFHPSPIPQSSILSAMPAIARVARMARNARDARDARVTRVTRATQRKSRQLASRIQFRQQGSWCSGITPA